jgi:hypothetical protein
MPDRAAVNEPEGRTRCKRHQSLKQTINYFFISKKI